MTVVLKRRDGGAISPCTWGSRAGIYTETEETSFLDWGLLQPYPTEYSYRVRCFAEDENGERCFGEPGSIITGHTVGKVSIPAVTTQGSKTLRVTWTPIPGAVGYIVYRNTSLEDNYNQISQTMVPRYADAGMQQGLPCYYRVKAVGVHGPGTLSAYMEGMQLGVPTLEEPMVERHQWGNYQYTFSYYSIYFQWSEAEGATGYVLYRGRSGSQSWVIWDQLSHLSVVG